MNTPVQKRNVRWGWRPLLAKVNAPIRIRFGVTSLLVFVTLASIWLAKISSEARQQKSAVKKIRTNGGTVSFDTNFNVDYSLRSFLGEEYFRTVTEVRLTPSYGTDHSSARAKSADAFFDALASLADMETLKIGNNRYVSDSDLAHLKSLSNLTKLHMSETDIHGTGLVHVSTLPKLERILLSHTHLQDSSLKHLGRMESLTEVFLDNTKVTDAGMTDLVKAKALRELSLRFTNITDIGLMQLEQLKQLEMLDVDGTFVTSEGVSRFRQAVPNCRVLVRFGLGEVPTEELLFPREHQPTLAEINARFKELKIDGEVTSFSSRPDNPSVALRLTSSRLSDTVLLSLANQIPDLKYISLDKALVGDEFLEGIREKKIRSLKLESTRVTDEGLRHVALMPKLERLVLKGPTLSDRGMDYLHHLGSYIELITVDLDTHVTSDGIKRLEEALPMCEVHGLVHR